MPYTLAPELKLGEESPIVTATFNNVDYSYSVAPYSGRVKKRWSRTGTNTPKGVRIKDPVRYYYVEVVKYHKTGKRLAFKVKSKKTGKLIWARERIPYTTVRRKRLPQSSYVKRSNYSSPNSLEFKQTEVQYGPDLDFTVQHVSIPTLQEKYKGPCYGHFKPIQVSGVLGPDHAVLVNEVYSSYISPVITKLDDLALNKLYQRVKDVKINVAQALAERAQTGKMLLDSVKRVLGALWELKRGNLKGAAKDLFPSNSKDLSNDWLAFQFGVLPLLSDIDGMCQYLATEKPQEFDVIVKKKEKMPERLIYTDTGFTRCKCITKVYSFAEVEVVHKVRVKINRVVPEFQRLSEMGFLDPSALAWELFPYSFVVDWFLPIGQYLQNMDAFTTLTPLHYHKTVFVKEELRVDRAFGGTTNYGYAWPNVNTSVTLKRTYCKRTPLGSPPALGYPEWKNPLSFTHVADIFALIRQLK